MEGQTSAGDAAPERSWLCCQRTGKSRTLRSHNVGERPGGRHARWGPRPTTTGRDRLANMTDAVHMNAPVATADPVVAIPFIGIGHFDEGQHDGVHEGADVWRDPPMRRESGCPVWVAGVTHVSSLGGVRALRNLLPRDTTNVGRPMRLIRPQRAPGGPRAPRRPHLKGGGCDGPPGMAELAIDDALAAIWRRGTLVCEVDIDGPRAAAYVIGWFAKWPPSKPICLSILA